MATFRNAVAALAATALAATGLLAGTGSAVAADAFTFAYNPVGRGDLVIVVTNETARDKAGYGEWNQDPSRHTPGDAIIARDTLADGYGIEVHLNTGPGRNASTRGSNSRVSVSVSGNLPEANGFLMTVCVVRGDFARCSGSVRVVA